MARTQRIDPTGSHSPNINAKAVATLTAFSTADADGGPFEVYITAAATWTGTPAGGQTAVSITPGAGVLPYRVPFLVSSVGAGNVATFIATY